MSQTATQLIIVQSLPWFQTELAQRHDHNDDGDMSTSPLINEVSFHVTLSAPFIAFRCPHAQFHRSYPHMQILAIPPHEEERPQSTRSKTKCGFSSYVAAKHETRSDL